MIIGSVTNKMGITKEWKLITISEMISESGVFSDGDWVETKDQDPNGAVRLIQLADIGDGEFKNKSKRFLTFEKAKQLNCTFLRKGDLLVARLPDPLGRACIFQLEGNSKFVTVVDICIIRPENKFISIPYLKYVINSPQSRNKISELQSGSTRKRISRKNLSTIKLPLPPLPEQHRIVAKIEELFSELDNGIDNLQRAKEQLKVYRQSVLKWAFEGRLTNDLSNETLLPDSWSWVDIDHFFSSGIKGMNTGPFGTMLKKHEHKDSGVPVLGIENIGEGNFKMPNKIFVSKEKAKELRSFMVNTDDIIISRSGTVGEICRVPDSMRNSIISTNLIKINLDNCIIDSRFFVYLFQGGNIRQQVFNLCKGSSRAFLNQRILRSLKFPFCSIKEQYQVIQEIEIRFSVADNLDKTIDETLLRTEALRQSILRSAFEGRLV